MIRILLSLLNNQFHYAMMPELFKRQPEGTFLLDIITFDQTIAIRRPSDT